MINSALTFFSPSTTQLDAAAEQLGDEVRRITMEALRGITADRAITGSNEPQVKFRCNIESTIIEVETKVLELRQDLQYEHANPIDKLVIEQLLTAWVQWYVSGWLLEGELIPNRTWRQNQYFLRRYQTSQAKLTKAIDQLSRIRQISPSNFHITTPEDIAERKRIQQQHDAEYQSRQLEWQKQAEEEHQREQEEDDD